MFGGWHPKEMGNLNLRIFVPQNSMSTLKILSLEAQYPKGVDKHSGKSGW